MCPKLSLFRVSSTDETVPPILATVTVLVLVGDYLELDEFMKSTKRTSHKKLENAELTFKFNDKRNKLLVRLLTSKLLV